MSKQSHALLMGLIILLMVMGAIACSQGQKADVDIEARILRLTEGTPSIVRVSELRAGQHYEFEVTSSTVIKQAGKDITFKDLQLGYHIHVRANQSQTSPDRYEAFYIDVTDSGEASPLRR